jgi:toxin ParE1/3/4
MGRRIVYSPDSRRDYEEIYLYIAADNPAAAERLLRTFDEKLQLALTAPGMGEPHPELGKGIRTLKAGRYIIFYREVPEGIQVVRVIHGARDIPSIFLFIADSVDHISGHSIRAEGQRSACTHENVRKTRLYQAMESTQTPYDL